MTKSRHQIVHYAAKCLFFFAFVISAVLFSACEAGGGKVVTEWWTSNVYDVSCFKNKVFAVRADYLSIEQVYKDEYEYDYWDLKVNYSYTQSADYKIEIPDQAVFSPVSITTESLEILNVLPEADFELSMTFERGTVIVSETQYTEVCRLYRGNELYLSCLFHYAVLSEDKDVLTFPDGGYYDEYSGLDFAIILIDQSKFPHSSYREWFDILELGNFNQTPIFW